MCGCDVAKLLSVFKANRVFLIVTFTEGHELWNSNCELLPSYHNVLFDAKYGKRVSS